jgi:hypothetical protein
MRGDPGTRITAHRGRLGPIAALTVAAASVLAGCGGGDDADTARGSTSTTAPATASSDPTTSTGATTTSTGGATSSTTGTTTSPSCPPPGGTADVRDDFPARMSSLVGNHVRTGSHDCFERFVIELQPSGAPISSAFPGSWVRYATGPIVLQPKGEQVTIGGKATLLVSMGSPMRTTDGGGYQGPTDVVPSGGTVILEYRLVEDFEGQSTWAIGLDRQRSFTVTVLDGPPRLVVDIAT